MKRTLYIVTGVAGSGKSAVSKEVQAYANCVDFDRTRDIEAAVLADPRPAVLTITLGVRSVARKLAGKFWLRVAVIDESLDVLKARIEGRGGVYREASCARRIRSLRLISKAAEFTGPADAVCQWLKHQLRTDQGVDTSASKTFYVYHILVNGVVRYVGKGHRDPALRYDRLSLYSQDAYLRNNSTQAAPALILAARASGDAVTFAVVSDNLDEFSAFQRERQEITEHPGLVNRALGGGRRGFTFTEETRRKLSEAQKRSHRLKPRAPPTLESRAKMRAAKLGKSSTAESRAAASANVKTHWDNHREAKLAAFRSSQNMGRPGGWTLSDVEAAALGLSAGRQTLSSDQIKKVRSLRYAAKKAQFSPTGNAQP